MDILKTYPPPHRVVNFQPNSRGLRLPCLLREAAARGRVQLALLRRPRLHLRAVLRLAGARSKFSTHHINTPLFRSFFIEHFWRKQRAAISTHAAIPPPELLNLIQCVCIPGNSGPSFCFSLGFRALVLLFENASRRVFRYERLLFSQCGKILPGGG